MNSLNLLQEFHSRPPPVPLSLLSSHSNESFYSDANTTLLNLACKTAQNRRRKTIEQRSSDVVRIKVQSPLFPSLSSDNARIQRVYSEVMMNSHETSKASLFSQHSIERSPLSPARSTQSTFRLAQGCSSRDVRQKPVSRRGLATSSSSADTQEPPTRRRRGQVLGQALLKPREIREVFNKPTDLSLIQKPRPPVIVHCASDKDEDQGDDEDWAAFITSGYGDFPLPPHHISPSSTLHSASTFLSPSTCATSLPSSDLLKAGKDWPDEELAWTSSDENSVLSRSNKIDYEEEEEFVQSPNEVTRSKSFVKERNSGSSDVSSTLHPSPDDEMKRKRQDEVAAFFAKREAKQKQRLLQLASTCQKGDASTLSKGMPQRMFGRKAILDRHGSFSSVASSSTSAAFSRESVSTRPSSVSTASSPNLNCNPPLIGHKGYNEDEEQSISPANGLQEAMHRSKSSTDLLRLLRSDQHGLLTQRSPTHSDKDFEVEAEHLTSLAYLHPDSLRKQKSRGKLLSSRFAARMNMASQPRRTSTPDAPVTPHSATSDVEVSHGNVRTSMSPSSAIFGSAAINARASVYVSAAAAAAAATTSTSRLAVPESFSDQHRRQLRGDVLITVPPAGFCFDYDPKSPLYLSSAEDSPGPTSPIGIIITTPTTNKSPPSSSFWRRNHTKSMVNESYKVASSTTTKFPHLRRKASFRLFK